MSEMPMLSVPFPSANEPKSRSHSSAVVGSRWRKSASRGACSGQQAATRTGGAHVAPDAMDRVAPGGQSPARCGRARPRKTVLTDSQSSDSYTAVIGTGTRYLHDVISRRSATPRSASVQKSAIKKFQHERFGRSQKSRIAVHFFEKYRIS